MTSQKLINWLSYETDNNKLVFDEILVIHTRLQNFIKNKNLQLNETSEIFLIKLVLFLYKNSKK